ncbi:MAG: carboxymuconolactone decarboxylase family protein [Fibrobacterota bacterium]|nr:carboxymuconolactone decarboxylase family protein [Fibrobacterota bacterium]QQS06038.1 MAG: carboxymuconolactone decarboxylase family protein [Fibrobacterota bacterium]
MTKLTFRELELVSLGAAIASNCVPCIEFHVPAARKAGLTDAQILEAIAKADSIKQVPARKILETARALLNTGSDVCNDPDCGCSATEPKSANACCA